MIHQFKSIVRYAAGKVYQCPILGLGLLILPGICYGGGHPLAPDSLSGGFIIPVLCATFILRLYLRHRARQCPTCHTRMFHLKKGAQDACLNENQRKEKSLHSVTFYVWQCRKCGFSKVKAHKSFFSRYKKCRKCKRRTMSIERRIIEKATVNSEGKGLARQYCWNCLYETEETYIISRKES